MKILLCTTNKGKVKEFKEKMEEFDFFTLKDEGISVDIIEDGATFEENALIKLNAIRELYPDLEKKYDCIIAEDSGLCVESLNLDPGVFSARYAGEHGNDTANNNKLLSELKGIENRTAYYQACIACFYKDDSHIYCGKVFGSIAHEEKGTNGFGYDSLFIPKGYSQTFGELNAEIKKEISHRSEAIIQMVNALF